MDTWLDFYNGERPHSGRYCYGKTPLQTFAEAKHLAAEKMLDQLHRTNSLQDLTTAAVR